MTNNEDHGRVVVKDRKSLICLVHQMANDLRTHPERWENGDLGGYFEAMAGWLEDMDGYYTNKGIQAPDMPTWEFVAELLQAAIVYE